MRPPRKNEPPRPPDENIFRATTAEVNEISRLAGKSHKEFSDAFFKSAKHGWNWALDTLLKIPADETGGQKMTVDMVNDFGATALMYVAQNGYHRTAEMLISKGADVNAQDNAGSTPLMLAAQKGWPAMVLFLLEQDAKIDLQNAEGKTALHLAVQHGHYRPVQMLMAAGANPLIRDKEGKLALDLVIHKDERIEEILFSYTQEKLEAEKLRLEKEAQEQTRKNLERLDHLSRRRPPKRD